MIAGSDPDRNLLEAVAQGDTGALRKLYERYGNCMLNYLDGMLEDRQSAEEILQDVMFKVWRSAATFRGDCKVRTWLYTIAHNEAIDHLRQRKVQVVSFEESIGVNQADMLENFDDRECLRAAMDDLSVCYRAVLELKFYHGLTMVEIAQVMGVPLGTVQSRLNTAKDNLKHILQMRGVHHA